jgi:hypothetical protein
MKEKWIILANWAISPLWYVVGTFIYFIAGNLASGQTVCSGVADVIITGLMAIVLIPIAAISYYSYYPFHLLAYYAISGTMIYIGYRIYKKRVIKKGSGVK